MAQLHAISSCSSTNLLFNSSKQDFCRGYDKVKSSRRMPSKEHVGLKSSEFHGVAVSQKTAKVGLVRKNHAIKAVLASDKEVSISSGADGKILRKKLNKVVLAYSGGLDTSVIVPWLRENYGCEVVCFTADVGQGVQELEGLEQKAKASGACQLVVKDLKEEFVKDFIFPCLRAGAIYERKYLLGTSMARPVIAKAMVDVANEVGADAVSHGCTGKGNDQVRFELTFFALNPELNVVAPWREWEITGREDAIEYAKKHDVPVPVTKKSIYSRDRNLWHLSHEGDILEDPANEAKEDMYMLTVDPKSAPDEPEYVQIGIVQGLPVSVNGEQLSPASLLTKLNEIGGKHGIGRTDMVENRLVGMKSRGVYETPGGTILFNAVRELESLTLDRETIQVKDSLALKYAELVYAGRWFDPLRESMDAFMKEITKTTTGSVTLKLYKGSVNVASRASPYSLYRQDISSFESGDIYNQADAAGFIRLYGLPMRVRAMLEKDLTLLVQMRLPKTISPLSTIARFHTDAFSTAYLNRRINECVCNSKLNDAHKLFDEFPHSRNAVSWNALINGYMKARQFTQAQKLFDEMPHRDVVSWNILISGYRDAHSPEKAHHHFLQMMRSDSRPDELTFAVIISAVLNTELDVLVPQFHALVLRLGHGRNRYMESALMRGYVGLRDRDGFCRVFDEVPEKHVVVWNVLILGYFEFGLLNEAKRAFGSMPRKTAYSFSIMIKGFMKNRMVNEARDIFEALPEKDVVSWTAMITGCAQCEKFIEALEMFVQMMSSGTVCPNGYTFSSVLLACSGCSSLAMGNQVHACLLKLVIPFDVVYGSSLVDMYAKCGDIAAAFRVFESMATKNCVSWNSIIGGYARHGLAERALVEFRRMIMSNIIPDQISFINVLSACVHGGKVREAEVIFNSMKGEYGVQPEMAHYSCMVDLYGRAGQLEKAEEVIKTMPFEPDVVVWGALLGACGLHSCLELGEFAAMGMSKVENDHPALYWTLSKIYGENGARSGVFQLEKMMEKWGVRKQKALSWIQ